MPTCMHTQKSCSPSRHRRLCLVPPAHLCIAHRLASQRTSMQQWSTTGQVLGEQSQGCTRMGSLTYGCCPTSACVGRLQVRRLRLAFWQHGLHAMVLYAVCSRVRSGTWNFRCHTNTRSKGNRNAAHADCPGCNTRRHAAWPYAILAFNDRIRRHASSESHISVQIIGMMPARCCGTCMTTMLFCCMQLMRCATRHGRHWWVA